MKKRVNSGYEIIESCTIGKTELVIGHNSKTANPYVCWYCKGGNDYFWGIYCNTIEAARENLIKRYKNELLMPYNNFARKQEYEEEFDI